MGPVLSENSHAPVVAMEWSVRVKKIREFVNSTVYSALTGEYCDIRSVASHLRAADVVSPSDFEKIGHNQSLRGANDYFHQLLDRDPSVGKLRDFSTALKKDTYRDCHQKLAEDIDVFLQVLDMYKILLVGKTGSGKTSFANLLCNFAQAQSILDNPKKVANLEQFRQFIDMDLERKDAGPKESKNFGARLYNTQLINGRHIGIIDTPGFGDIRGFEQDKENAKEIISAIENEEYINCICLVINGRQSRMSASLEYVLSEVLPKEALNNVILVFTNTSDPLQLNLDPNCLEKFFGRSFNNSRDIFVLENPYCSLEKAKVAQQNKRLPEEKIAKSVLKGFKETSEVLEELCEVLKDFNQIHTKKFLQLYRKKQEIEENVLRSLTAYDNQQNVEKAIAEVEENIKAAAATKSLNANFKVTQKVSKWVTINTDRHNILCAARDCYSNCQLACYLEKSLEKERFKTAACFGGKEECQVCGHSYDIHYYNERRFDLQEYEEELVDDQMKVKFEKAEYQKKKQQDLQMKLEIKREESKRETQGLAERLSRDITEFKKMSISQSYVQLIQHQLIVIKQRLEATVGSKTEPLMKTKEELELKLKIVQGQI